MVKKNNIENLLQPLDTKWFDESAEEYLAQEEFKEFQRVAGVDFRDLLSGNPEKKRAVQEKLVSQSILLNETRNEYAGYMMPLLYYTHDLRLGKKVPNHNPEHEQIWFHFDMGDSLRRRHIALSDMIIPEQISALEEEIKKPLMIANLGSGIGLDVMNAITKTNGKVEKVLNYDINPKSTELGKRTAAYLEKNNSLKKGVVEFHNKNLLANKTPNDLSILIGIICGLNDSAAVNLLRRVYKTLNPNGRVIVSSSNKYMRCTDPLPNFVIQHLGKKDNPSAGWGLNFRSQTKIYDTFYQAGFREIRVYDDADYPGKDRLSEERLNRFEELPARVLGLKPLKEKYTIPPKHILNRTIGYNWIAIGKKLNN